MGKIKTAKQGVWSWLIWRRSSFVLNLLKDYGRAQRATRMCRPALRRWLRSGFGGREKYLIAVKEIQTALYAG